MRLEDIQHVGPNEVDLDLLNTHLLMLKSSKGIVKPLVNYKENEILQEVVSEKKYDLIIVEGIYVSLLEQLDIKIFIQRTYLETRAA